MFQILVFQTQKQPPPYNNNFLDNYTLSASTAGESHDDQACDHPSSVHGHSGLLRASSRHSIRQGTIDRRKAIGLRTVLVLSSAARSRGSPRDHLGGGRVRDAAAVSTEVTRRR
jgi:hypothetical protein